MTEHAHNLGAGATNQMPLPPPPLKNEYFHAPDTRGMSLKFVMFSFVLPAALMLLCVVAVSLPDESACKATGDVVVRYKKVELSPPLWAARKVERHSCTDGSVRWVEARP